MPTLKIDGRQVSVAAGATVLEAAQSLGIQVPTLCRLPGAEPHTSCMVCVVKDLASGRLVPACSAPAEGGMAVATGGDEVVRARRNALNFLLAEHVGDCRAPCQLACPARLDIPGMIRLAAQGHLGEAGELAREALALPGVLGCICPGPCEKTCRRGRQDAPLAIAALHRCLAEADPAANGPPCHPATGRRVAVVGAGPVGLAAACHLARAGHACVVFDERAEPGGYLRYDLPPAVLPREVLDRDLAAISRLGTEFRLGAQVGTDVRAVQLMAEFDAIVLATGRPDLRLAADLGLAVAGEDVRVDAGTFRTSDPRIVAGGAASHGGHLVVRAVARGKIMARSVDLFLGGRAVADLPAAGPSRMGKLLPGEMDEFMPGADASPRTAPAAGDKAGFSAAEAAAEARRCLHCDCRKLATCGLRRLAEEYGAEQHRFRVESRRPFARDASHPQIVYEPGKCIKCGICVRVAARAGERPGLAFLGRGFEVAVGAPFAEPLSAALKTAAAECARLCPTGALALKE